MIITTTDYNIRLASLPAHVDGLACCRAANWVCSRAGQVALTAQAVSCVAYQFVL
jgi:hypothetical protein